MKTRKKSVGTRYLIFFYMIAIVSSLVAAAILYVGQRKQIRAELDERMDMLAVLVVNELNVDDVLKIEDSTSDGYAGVLDILRKYQNAGKISRIYIAKAYDDDNYKLLVDAEEETVMVSGEVYAMDDYMKQAFANESVEIGHTVEDEDGTQYRVLKPLYTEDGTVAAVISCDYNVETFQANLHIYIIRFLLGALAWTAVISAAVAGIGRNMNRSMTALNDKMVAVINNSGNLREKVEVHSGDEFEVLADNFNAMSAKMYTTIFRIKMLETELTTLVAKISDQRQIQNEQKEFQLNLVQKTEDTLKKNNEFMEELWDKMMSLVYNSDTNNEFIKEQMDTLNKNEHIFHDKKDVIIKNGIEIHGKMVKLGEILEKNKEHMSVEDVDTVKNIVANDEKDFQVYQEFIETMGVLLDSSREGREACARRLIRCDEMVIDLKGSVEKLMSFEQVQDERAIDMTQRLQKFKEVADQMSILIDQVERTVHLIEKEIFTYGVSDNEK